jgi:hypothetical protein
MVTKPHHESHRPVDLDLLELFSDRRTQEVQADGAVMQEWSHSEDSCFHAIAHGKFRFVFPQRGKAEELSEPSVVEIAGGRLAVRLDPFGVLHPK